ncbi:response regulator transcription factor [Flammeovirga kamogawensis]|nr:response regulator transcription factor [Flammeovirga kamogawensis]
MMKYIIIDDEPIAHRIIESYCDKTPYMEKVGNAYDAFDALELLQNTTTDLIFLDINMPKMNGFEMLRTLTQKPNVIVTSAYQEYAVEGFELNVVDYLLKPFSFPRFLSAVNKIDLEKKTAKEDDKIDRFFIKVDKKLVGVNIKDVLYIEACGNYIKLHQKDKVLVSHQKLSFFEEMLTEKHPFIRVHKSFLVNTDHIELMEGNYLKLLEHQVPVGQKYKKEVIEKLHI